MRLLLVATLAALFSAIGFQSEATTVLRFREVWDGERLLQNASIVVQGQRIVAVGANVDPPKGARHVDLRRFTALPGLIDLHTHITYVWDRAPGTTPLRPGKRRTPDETADAAVENARRTLESGVTTIRDLGASGGADILMRDRVAAGTVRGPRMFVAGRGISAGRGRGPLPEAMRAEVDARVQSGSDWIKAYASRGSFDSVETTQTLTFEQMKAIVDAAHAAGRKVAIHSYGASGVKDAVRAGADSIEHGIELDDETLAEMVRRRTVWVPTIDHNRYYVDAKDEYGFSPEAIPPLQNYIAKNFESTRRAFKAGVRLGMGSDAVFTGFGQNTRELEWFVKAGMTPAQALQTATTIAAELLDRGDSLGRLKAGFSADIIAVEGQPLKDIGAVVTGVRWVMKDGVVVVEEQSGRSEQHAGHPLGSVDFPVTCSDRAKLEFNRAVALLHHMTYPQAREAFQRIATTDPACAMPHWGIAMTLFQPLWPTRPTRAQLQRGWDEVRKAKALQPPTERERLFIAAAEAFFLEPESSDYWLRIRRWEAASEKVFLAFPDDPEAAAFFALAHLATAPSNEISRTHSDRAAEILLRVYARNPDHPGAMHYLVHANDVPGRERESLEITRRYEAVAPRNPHALHMPTHIYTRLGDWDAVIRGNVRAADAALEHPAGERGEYVWDEFPHAIEYVVYAHLQKGADGEAAAALKRLRATERLEPTFKTAFHLASTQARDVLERRAWNEAVQIVPREPATLDWDRFAWPEAIAWFARGLAFARTANLAQASAAAQRLQTLETMTRKASEDLFARNIRVLALELNAWMAHVEGRTESSQALMREAAALETSTPKHAVTPGPTLPAHELFGDLLMEQKQPQEALAAYKESLERYPGRFNSLLGAARSARALGDESSAGTFYQKLLDVAEGGTRESVKEARAYIAERRK